MKRALFLLLATSLAGAAHAQETQTVPAPSADPSASTNGRVVYGLDFFAQFSPQNALDMVNRVPGFSLDEGSDRRGFSGAAGNVLVDGRRPSAKSQSLSSILSRIPAAQVARVELIRDTSNQADAAGQSMLVNVVRTPSAGGGVWEASFEVSEGVRIMPRGEVSWTGRVNEFDYSIGVSRFIEYRPLAGGRELTDAAGALTATRTDISPRNFRENAINGEVTFPLLGGSLRTNGQVNFWNFRAELDSLGFDSGGVPTDDFVLLINERQQTEEVGFNFDRPLGPGSMEIIGLATRRHYANDEATDFFAPAGGFVGAVAQVRRNESGETILRTTYSWPASETVRVDLGGEIAFNSLDTDLVFTEDDGSGPVAVPLPAANVLVEEGRAEGSVAIVWRPAPDWTIEGVAAGETSTLTQTGDTNLETELAYFKPSLQVTRQLGDRSQVRARLYRDVDQLDFDDFVSAAGLADDIVFGGNPNLRPQTSWRAEVAGDWRFDTEGAVSVTLFYHQLKEAADVVPVGPPGDRFDAPGNIGEGWVYGADINATIPTGFVLPNSRLTVRVELEESEVTDPVTGDPRIISGWVGREVELNFRQDLTAQQLAWGFYFYKASENITFRLNEADAYEEGPFLDFFVETTAIPGIKVRAFANNVLDSEFRRRREFFAPDRNGPLDFVEARQRQFGMFYGLVISGTL